MSEEFLMYSELESKDGKKLYCYAVLSSNKYVVECSTSKDEIVEKLQRERISLRLKS
jgi:hypothetical protein